MTRKMFSGFYSPNERWADNRPLYQSALAGRSGVVSREEAEQQLAFYEQFPPGLPHDRLVAQEIGVYTIEPPSWTKPNRVGLVVPQGEEKKILEVDLGAELVSMASGRPSVEEVVQRNVVQKLEDGTFIRGDIFRYVSPETSNLAALEEYVTTEFHEGSYAVYPRAEIQRRNRIFTYHLTSYFAIDGQRMKENRIKLLPGFKTEWKGTDPIRFGSWVTKGMNRCRMD